MMKRDDRIDYLKAVACILVVCCHVFISRVEVADSSKCWSALWLLAYTICIPLFFGIAGWLNHEETLRAYLAKKTQRILVPFCLFSLLKILYSIFISSHYAHGGAILFQIADAFVFGRLYWFAYAIFGVMMLAPLFWKLSNIRLVAVFGISIVLSLLSKYFPACLQVNAVFSLLPCFIAGMFARRMCAPRFLDSRVGRLCKYGTLIMSCIGAILYLVYLFSWATSYAIPNKVSYFLAAVSLIVPLIWGISHLPQGIAWLAFIGRNSWAIMFFDSFFKAVLIHVFDTAYSTALVILFDVLLSALVCRLLMHVPGCFIFGVTTR